MVGKEQALELVRKALAYSTAEQTQVQLMTGETALTRFAENFIHQNVSESNARLLIKVVVGKKIATTSTNDLSDQGIERVVKSACEIVAWSNDDPQFVSLPAPSVEAYPQVVSYAEPTAGFDAEQRAEAVKVIIDKAKSGGFTTAGALSTSVSEIAIANSLGIAAYNANTRASVSTVMMSEDSAGYASDSATNVEDISFADVAEKAFRKCSDSRNAVAIEPGDYEVILEPDAAGTLCGYFARASFNPISYSEGRSVLAGKLGTQLLGGNITVWDDGLDPSGMPQPFDYEGMPKQRVLLVDQGVPQALVYDSYSANLEGRASTGHGTPFGKGGMPMHLFMQPGDASIEDMIKSTKRGLLVTRFHYVNMVHPMKVVITGMTRDGTFLVEDGEIRGPVKNLRFTQSVLDALNDVQMISKDTARMGSGRVPALKIGKFTFTGVTEH